MNFSTSILIAEALILSPLMVCEQTQAEFARWYGHEHDIEYVPGNKLQAWLDNCGGKIAIANYDVFKHDYGRGQLGCLILDESSILKSHYGKYGEKILLLGRGLDWKLCGTGTPAPNDRIEYANHAVFLDQYPTVNSFLARYFVNRGQTGERWELKNHALEPFYRHLSHWSIFLTNPATYGWSDNCETIPPIHVHIHDVDMTEEQNVDASTRSIRIQATVANPRERLRPGMFAEVAVVLASRNEVIAIPTTSVLYAPYGDSVFVVEEKKSEKTGEPVKTLRQQFARLGEKRGDFVSVVSGVKEGEAVVSTGVFKLRNGQDVVVDNTLSPEFKLRPVPENK